MRWTIRNKLILGCGVVVSVFAIAAFIAHRHTRLVTENLTHVTAIATPLKDAAQEMEINLLGTGFAVLGYLHYRDPVFMTRMRDDSDDFVRSWGRYQALANTPTLHELGE